MKALFSEKVRVWTLLICGSALYFFANIQRVAIPGSIFDELQTALQISIDLLPMYSRCGKPEVWIVPQIPYKNNKNI